jgi:S1-C subfamily serine protease
MDEHISDSTPSPDERTDAPLRQPAHGYTDFEGRQRLLAAEPQPTPFDAPTRPLPIPPTPSEPRPDQPARRGGGRWASLLVVLALIVGLLAGGAGGYALGDRHDASASASVATAPNPIVAQNAATGATPSSSTATASSATPTTGASGIANLSDLVARVNPAVVTIEGAVTSQDPFGQSVSGTQTGSGYIIDTDGHIVTNNHVVDGATSLKVTYSDGRQVDATVVGTDAFQDVAVIKVNGPVPATVAFGDSSQVRSGDSVVAIGSALGEFHNSVTNGIVSGTDRSLDTGQGYRLANLIQHNASISPGNSGGPLLNDKGEVIGMNTAVVRGNGTSAEGLGFAIASNTVKQIADELIQNGQANYPYMGVQFSIAQSAQGNGDITGVTLTQVTSGGPASQAGLKVGDTITAVDGTQISSEQPFLNLVFAHQPGDSVQFSVTPRSGQPTTITVVLAPRPPAAK